MRVSILIMAFLPPFRALTSASSARVAASLHWASSSFLSFSRFMASSCSKRSSSGQHQPWRGRPCPQRASPRWSSRPGQRSAAKLTLKLPLGGGDGLVDVGEVSQSLVGVSELLLSSTALAVSGLKKSTSLLKTVGNSSGPAVGGDLGVGSGRLGGGLLVHLDLSVTHLEGVLLYGGLGLSVASNSMLKSQAKVSSVSLKLLLHPESLSLALGLGLKSHLHGVKSLGLGLLDEDEPLLLLS